MIASIHLTQLWLLVFFLLKALIFRMRNLRVDFFRVWEDWRYDPVDFEAFDDPTPVVYYLEGWTDDCLFGVLLEWDWAWIMIDFGSIWLSMINGVWIWLIWIKHRSIINNFTHHGFNSLWIDGIYYLFVYHWYH